MDRLTVAQLEVLYRSDLFAQTLNAGCKCPSCKYTTSFYSKGFAAWPTGKPAGKSAARDYAAHVAFGKRTPDRMAIPSLEVLSFYGPAKGVTRAQARETLARHFAEERDWDAFDAALVKFKVDVEAVERESLRAREADYAAARAKYEARRLSARADRYRKAA